MAVLGRKHWYRYTTDFDTDYKIQMLDYLAEAAGLELDDTMPDLPREFEPRFVWLQEDTKTPRPIRKKLVFQRKDGERFQLGARVEVAGIIMVVKSSYGESRKRIGRNHNIMSKVEVEITRENSEG